VEAGTPVNFVLAAPVRTPAEVRMALTLASAYVVQDGSSGSTSWKFSVLASEDSLVPAREILSVPQAAYDDGAAQPKSVKRQVRLNAREGNTLQITVRGVSQSGTAAEGHFRIFMKPADRWTATETVRLPVIVWNDSSKGSFVLVFELVAEPPAAQ
jgi:hypothetical protein